MSVAQCITGGAASRVRRAGSRPRPVQSTRRNTELLLLGFAVLITTLSLVLVEASQEQSDHLGPRQVRAGLSRRCSLIAHLAVRRFAPYADPLLLPIVALLNGLGLVLIHRLDLADAQTAAYLGLPDPVAGRQPAGAVDGAGHRRFRGGAGAAQATTALLARYGYTLGLAGLVLPRHSRRSCRRAFSEVNGAKIWIRLPGFSIQPGEFAKILLIIFFASVLVAKRDLFTTAGKHVLGMDFPRARDLGPILRRLDRVGRRARVREGPRHVAAALQHRAGDALHRHRARRLAADRRRTARASASSSPTSCSATSGSASSTWLDPLADYNNTGYQISQSLFGLATGGLAGTGLGSGRPVQVPFAKTDFIVATIGEELGLIGLAAVLMLFLIFVIRGLRTALAVRDSFGKLLAAGLSFTIAIQVFVVVGGVTKLIPLTGLTTPFMSYGGSSLLANYLLLAMLIKISDAARAAGRRRRRRARAPDRRRPDRDGAAHMNTPLRRVAIAVMVMVVALLANATYVQVIKADDLRSRPAQLAGAARRVLAPARPDLGGRPGARGVRPDRRPLQVPAHLPAEPGGTVQPAGQRTGHRLLLDAVRQHRSRAGRGPGPQRFRQPAVRPTLLRPRVRPRPARRQRGDHAQPGHAAGRVRPADGEGLHRFGRGDRAEHRRDPHDGQHPELRPQPARQPRRRRDHRRRGRP